ncbi:MAG: NAD(P)H-hydrate dehydratase [Chitinophagaceae bacterium]|nr:NAD(P)H-hydrate dehydratase [Chitinophagaceae bacterium]
MKVLLNNEQIQQWDLFTQQEEPITGIQLMERAAEAATQWILSHVNPKQHLAVLVGPGNNGGDGLAIARQLLEAKYTVDVFHPKQFSAKSAAKHQFDQLKKSFPKCLHPLSNFNASHPAEILIDALFGTGIKPIAGGEFEKVIQQINTHPATCISLDIPSGLHADAETKPEIAVKAKYTLSFQTRKQAFLWPETGPLCGEIVELNIQLHPQFLTRTQSTYFLIEKKDIQALYKPRERFSHKGTYGHGLLLAGSVGKVGAALLASKAALRGGIGALTLRVPDSLCASIPLSMPEIMTEPYVHHGSPSEFHYKAWAAGCGLSTNEQAYLAFSQLLEQAPMPGIIDADALNLLVKHPELKKRLVKGCLLTPHPLEFDRLFGPSSRHAERIRKAIQFTQASGHFILLKSTHACLICPNGHVYFNSSGTPALAKGGSGDVLTGLLLALYANYQNMETAALMGMYLHGLAGEMTEAHQATESVLATDTANAIAQAFQQLQTG